jgi:hypothetical protein
MWIKDGAAAPSSIVIGGRRIVNPSATMYKLAGYTWVDPAEPVEDTAIKYSTLKIIRALGDHWGYYRRLLERAGVLDQFYAANYLRSDDPIFMAFVANVPEDTLTLLDDCLWGED